MNPILFVSFLIYCCGVFFINIIFYIKDKIKLRNKYFYCKYGGCMPLCSNCKRNHINSNLNTKSIKTWFIPQKGSKQCIGYFPNL